MAIALVALLAPAAAIGNDVASVDALWLAGDYARAQAAARQFIEAAPGAAARCTALAAWSRALAVDGRLADGEAGRAAREALELCVAEFGAHHLESLRASASLGLVELRSGDWDAARTRLAEVADAPTVREQADLGVMALVWLAEADVELSRFDEALSRLAEAEPLVPASSNAPVLGAMLLDQRANALLYRGELEPARQAAERAAAQAGRHPEAAFAHLLLRDQALQAGDVAGAGAFARAGLELADALLRPAHPLRASLLARVARDRSRAGAFDEAFEDHRLAIEAATVSLGPQHPQVADHLVFAGLAHFEAGDGERAAVYFEAALRPTEASRGADSLAVATVAYNLSNVYGDAARWPEAAAAISRALRIWEGRLGPAHPHVALGLAQKGWIQEGQGHHDDALESLRRALEVREAASGPDHPLAAEVRGSLAALLLKRGRFREAERHVERAIASLAPLAGWRDPSRAKIYALQALLRDHRGRRPEAARLGALSAQILADHLERNLRFLGERHALAYAGQDFAGRDILLSMAARRAATPEVKRQAFEAMVRARHLVLDEIAARSAHARAAADPELREAWAAYRDVRERLAMLVHRGADETVAGRVQLRALESEADEREQALALTGARRNLAARLPPVSLEELRRQLPARTALVSIVAHEARRAGRDPERRYLAFVVRPDRTEPSVVELGPASRIDRLVDRWQSLLVDDLHAGAPGVPQEPGEALRRAVWDPLAPRLRGAERVLLVPDDALLRVNFAALPVGRGKYLVESGPTLHLLSAERDLLRPALPAELPGRILIVAAPAFDAIEALNAPAADAPGPTASVAAFAPRGRPWPCRGSDVRWAPLPAAALEAADIRLLAAQRGEEAHVLVGPMATERAVKQLAGGFEIVHLATHGFQAGDACPASGSSWRPRDSPLLEVGLPLAGANERQHAAEADDDGILTAEELATLDLGRSRWVVLSACDTGRGRIVPREGVLGLRRALAVAGARTVVMSLWPVDDAHARVFMRALYEARLLHGADTADAVRQASLRVLETVRRERGGPAPASLWGAFVASGDWR